MAQLIKLQDYVSRYQQNILLYPSRFVRLKKQKWEGVKRAFETNKLLSIYTEATDKEDTAERETFLIKIKGLINRKPKEEETVFFSNETEMTVLQERELSFDYKTNGWNQPYNIEELKLQFLNQLFEFQMKWASSTLTEKSLVKKSYYYDETLKYYIQRFPDTYLVLYKPLFLLKNAPIELDTIIITPTDIWCITIIEEEDSAVFVGSKEKFWIKKNENEEIKILSPVISVNRTEKIVKSILDKEEIILPIKKVILTRNGYVDYPTAPFDIKVIEKRNYDEWFAFMRNNRSPIKAIQLKAAENLLHYCLTTSVRRYEWDSEE